MENLHLCGGRFPHRLRSMSPRACSDLPRGDKMDVNEEAKKIIESVKSDNTVKSLSDLKLEQLTKRLDDLEKLNKELIAANKELYAYAAAKDQAKAEISQTATEPINSNNAAEVKPSIGVVTPSSAPEDEPSVTNVMVKLGYPKTSPDGQ